MKPRMMHALRDKKSTFVHFVLPKSFDTGCGIGPLCMTEEVLKSKNMTSDVANITCDACKEEIKKLFNCEPK